MANSTTNLASNRFRSVEPEQSQWHAYSTASNQAMIGISTLELTMDFAKEHPRYALMYLLVIAMMPIQEILTPHLYGRVVSAIEMKKDLVMPIAAVATLVIILQIYEVASDLDDAVHHPALERFLRKRALDAIVSRHETNFEELETGGIISQLAKLPNIIYKYMDAFKYGVFPTMLTFIVGGVYFAYIDWTLAIIFTIVVAILGFVLVGASWKCVGLAMARDNEFTRMLEGFDDILQNLISVYNSGSHEREDKMLDDIQAEYSRYTRDTMMCVNKLRLYVTPLQVIFIVAFMWRCYCMVQQGRMKTGTFVSMFFIMVAMNNCITRSISSAREMVFRQGIIAESLQLFDRPPQRVLPTAMLAQQAAQHHHPVLQLKHVSYSYPGSKEPVVKDVSFRIDRGEHVVFVGHIGSGKSSLMRLIMRYHMPDKGELFVDGMNYERLDPKDIRRRIAYIPQQPVLFNRSIYDNITYSRMAPGTSKEHHISEERVWQLLESLGLKDMFMDMPDGLHTIAGKRGSHLSGGQRQIVWLLRVFLQAPSLLLLDEPTAAIDVKTKVRVQRLLRQIMEGRTVLMVTHDESIMKTATRYIRMSNGAVVGTGKLVDSSAGVAQHA
jgi:ATP-binding cassette, subfamily B, bacterial